MSCSSRKHPIHLRNLERHNQPVIVFLTVCAKDHQPILATQTMRDLLVAAWSSSGQWRVGHYVVMPDHVHLFCSPVVSDAENVRDWTAYWKRLVTRAVLGYGPLARSGVPMVDDRVGGAAATPPGPAVGDGVGGAAATPPTPSVGTGGTVPSRSIDGGVGGAAATPPTPSVGTGGTVPSRPVGNAAGGAATTPPICGTDSIWQRDCWDTQLRDQKHYEEKWQYVRMNPVRKGLVKHPDDWQFSGTLQELRW